MLSINFKKDLRFSIAVVWKIYSAIILLVIILSVFFPELLIKISPVCISKSVYGEDCFMCGMTRAFVEIPKGNFPEAYMLNSFSIILYSLFILNSLLLIYSTVINIGKNKNFKETILEINK